MADKIIPNLPKTELVTFDDLLLVVDTPSSAPTNKKITLKNFLGRMFLQGNSYAPETHTSSGVVTTTDRAIHLIDGSNVGVALTLAAGTEGQIKFFIMTAAGNNCTLTPAVSPANYTLITFNAVGETAQLLFSNGVWNIIGYYGATPS